MNKHLYILISKDSRAGSYGIGTYVEQLTSCCVGVPFNVTIVDMYNRNVSQVITTEKNGIRYITIPRSAYINYTTDLVEANKIGQRNAKVIPILLYPYVDRKEVNIFHLNCSSDNLLAERLKRYFNAKIILTVHYTEWSFDLLGDKQKLSDILNSETSGAQLNKKTRNILNKYWQERDLLNNHCDKIIAISMHSYKDLLSMYHADPAKMILVNNAQADDFRSITCTKRQKIRESLKINSDEFIILFAGRLDEVKGVDILVKSFCSISDRYPSKNMRLILAGDGNFNALSAIAAPKWTKVTFTGLISKEVLKKLYSIADIGVVPSRHEEFGYVAIEMMKYRLPLIVSDTTGLSEIVEHGKTGVKFPLFKDDGQSVNALSDALSLMIDNEEIGKRLVVAGRRKFKLCYDLPIFKDKMLDIYNSI